jgi:cell pole-organizing protein PopZ
MGHISHEPSMEEILSSIKRIIAEDSDAPAARARRHAAKPVQLAKKPIDPEPLEAAVETDEEAGDDAEILELTDAVAAPAPQPTEEPVMTSQAATARVESPLPELVSAQAAIASRDALASLSRLVVKPEESAADNTLEGLVRDMLRPMLKEWLDARLPDMVEAMVAKEIARISGQHG